MMEDLEKDQNASCCSKFQISRHGGDSGKTGVKALGLQLGCRNGEPRGTPSWMVWLLFCLPLSYIMETVNSCLSGAKG